MKKMLTAALLALCSMAQAHQYQPLALAKEEYKLNSASRPGGQTRAVIKITVPYQCDMVFVAVAASPKGALEDLALHSRITKKLTEAGAHISLSSQLLNDLITPKGDGVVDVLVMNDAVSAANFQNKQDKNTTYIPDYSRLNYSGGVIAIKTDASVITGNKTYYICLRNMSMFNAQFVKVEAVGMKVIK